MVQSQNEMFVQTFRSLENGAYVLVPESMVSNKHHSISEKKLSQIKCWVVKKEDGITFWGLKGNE